jgi:uroporphyrinogen decarboxylase
MSGPLSKRERLARIIAGESVDRPAVSLWRHFYVEETTRAGLVEAMVRWQRTYDWDFLKINPRYSYHGEDWGNRYATSGNDRVGPTMVHHRVHEAADFPALDRLSAGGLTGPASPVLADHLGAVGDLRKALGLDVPLLMTIFTPLAIAADLAGGPQALAAMVAADAAKVHVGLRTITDTFTEFAAQCVEAGADGIFLATTHVATPANFTLDQYAEFGRPYDLEILRAARGAPLNLLHVCQPRSMIRDLADYPVAMLNWDMATPTNPTLGQLAPAARGKALVGGVDRHLFADRGAAEKIRGQVAEARRAMGGLPFVLGSTCTIDTASEPDLVMMFREEANHA